MFKAINSTLTLKNLVLKNTNDSAIVLDNTRLITVNVTFMNANSADFGGAVYSSGSDYYSTNDKFIDNSAKDAGSAIYGTNSKIIINNATFTNKEAVRWSLLYGNNCIVDVSNSIFANATSKYATAILNDKKTYIKKFIQKTTK